ncbi:MAG TPA: alpha/beta hydrolase [Puia sp.]|nr:alpha/beta hydrolase [Puia sp.]
MEEGFIPVNGGEIFYFKKGSGTPMVFIHGFCLDHRMWNDQLEFFSENYTCIIVDLRGFGKSSLPSAQYSHHEDLKTLLDHLDIQERIVLIGLSMGGRFVINFSLVYPEKINALVLTDAVLDGYSFREFRLDYIYEAGKTMGIDIANQLWLNHPIFDPARKISSVCRRLKEMVISYSGWHWINKNPLVPLSIPSINQLDKIDSPTLILVGEHDIFDFQQIADILHRDIKNSVKEVIEGAGHMSNMEKPAEFNRLVQRFLKDHIK